MIVEYPIYKPDVKRFTMDFTRDQHKKLRMAAIRSGKNMRDLIREFVDSLPEPNDREDYVYRKVYR